MEEEKIICNDETFSGRKQISLTLCENVKMKLNEGKRGRKSMTLRDSIFPLIFPFSFLKANDDDK
jgi:predicted nucleic acid-binding protein